MGTYTVESSSRDGLDPTANAVASEDSFTNDGKTLIEVINADASPNTVTIVTQSTVDGLAVADKTVVVPAGEARIIGPFPKQIYNNTSGAVVVQHSNTTSNTARCFKLGS